MLDLGDLGDTFVPVAANSPFPLDLGNRMSKDVEALRPATVAYNATTPPAAILQDGKAPVKAKSQPVAQVDQLSGMQDTHRVYVDGSAEIYDSTMCLTSISTNNNKFAVIQVLQRKDSTEPDARHILAARNFKNPQLTVAFGVYSLGPSRRIWSVANGGTDAIERCNT